MPTAAVPAALLSLLLVALAILSSYVAFLYYRPLALIHHYRREGIPGDGFQLCGQSDEIHRAHASSSRLSLAQAKSEVYGAVYFTSLHRTVRLIVNDPRVIDAILREHSRCFAKTRTSKWVMAPLIGRNNLFLVDEPEHQCVKKFFLRSMRTMLSGSESETIIRALTARFVRAWTSEIERSESSNASGCVYELHGRIAQLTLEIIVARALGSVEPSLTHLFARTFDSVLSLQQQRSLAWTAAIPCLQQWPTRRKREVDQRTLAMKRTVRGIVQQRRQSMASAADGASDFLAVLLANPALDDEHVTEELLTLVLQGFETTANLIAWTLHELMNQPSARDRLRQEILANAGDSGSGKWPVLGAVMNESLRLWPPAPVMLRECQRVVRVTDSNDRSFTVPVGAVIVINSYVVHRMPSVWGEDAAHFRLSRWLEPTSDDGLARTFLPFGAGPRACIGSSLALTEARIILVELLRHFQFERAGNPEVVPHITLNMKPKFGLHATVRRQRYSH